MPNIDNIPAAPGVRENRNGGPIGRLADVIGGKRPRSIWAERHEAVAIDYEFLRQQADAAQKAVSGYRAELGEAEGRRARVLAAPTQGVTAEERQAALVEAEVEVERARNAYDAAITRSRQTTKSMNTALRHLRRVQVLYKATDEFQSVTPKPLPKGVDPTEEIARIDADVRKVKAAPPQQEEVVEGLLAQVDALADEAKVRVGSGNHPRLSFPVTRVAAIGSGEEIPNAPDPRPWIARHFRDSIAADIEAQVAERYRNVELTMSEKDKVARLAELADERLNADRVRCAAVWDKYAADNTISLDFPADADARAILGIAGRPVKLRDDDED